MTTFLFIPTGVDGQRPRQVDFAGIASLFAEAEEPVRPTGSGRRLLRMVAAVLLGLLAIGDTFLVARTLTSAPTTPPASRLAL